MSRNSANRLLSSLLFVLVAVGCAVNAQTPAAPLARATSAPRPTVTIESPAAGGVVQGVAIVRFRVQNIRMVSPFLAADSAPNTLPAGHLHVTVDGASWHWVHSSSDPVVVTPLTPGEHTVELELADANHRPLDAKTVRFTVAAKAASTEHAGHR